MLLIVLCIWYYRDFSNWIYLSALGSPMKPSTMGGPSKPDSSKTVAQATVELWTTIYLRLLRLWSYTLIEGGYANAAKCWLKLINSPRLCIVLPAAVGFSCGAHVQERHRLGYFRLFKVAGENIKIITCAVHYKTKKLYSPRNVQLRVTSVC